MVSRDERDERIAALEERLSRLGQASLRISESLDFDTVLQEVVDGARALTGSSYAAMAVDRGIGGSGGQYVVSAANEDARELLTDMPQGPAIYEHFSGLAEPLRIADLGRYLAGLGASGLLPPLPVTALLVAPLRHQGAGVGTIYLAHDAEGREYSREDEETLALFASQAALAVANAQRHREEQQTRADLETLIDTSPVAVVVLDAASGLPKTYNREMLRIADRLGAPEQTLEDLLEQAIFRRADGREISLREFQMTELLSIGETVRAEEIVLGVSDGRSARVLLNATPIVTAEGAVESVVVTLQDMAAVEELEHLRAEFLAVVSHELRAPLATIRGSASTVLDSAAELDPVVQQFVQIIGDQADHLISMVADLLDVARLETGELPIHPEPAEAMTLIDRARRAFLGAGGASSVQIDLEPDLPLVMADRRRVVQVLVNLLANAGRNSPESSVIRVSAARTDVHVAFSVADQGRGIPEENLPHLFRKFAGAASEEQGGDTGLGLAICKGIVEAHGGRIWAESDGPGLGARFTFTLPATATPSIAPRSPAPEQASADEEPPQPSQATRILVVDDIPQDLRYVRDTLSDEGFEPLVTGEPAEALQLMADKRPALVLLDLVLPETDGIDLMGQLHKIRDVPVIFLSAYGRDELIAQAFELGAVDYVVKPFSQTELLARIKAALRRLELPEPPTAYAHQGIYINFVERWVTLRGEPVQLTPTEYRMLAELAAHGGALVSYEQLLEQAWPGKSGDNLHPMRTMMGKLRQKLGETADEPRYIFTEPRVGYRMPKGEPLDPAESAERPADA
ncbi:MAG: response regulator [Chloroflexi bacterium]|nr:response regulator [Chloroflexota bacterium]MYC02955.1 response regulator [Chloroflexota bacterium]